MAKKSKPSTNEEQVKEVPMAPQKERNVLVSPKGPEVMAGQVFFELSPDQRTFIRDLQFVADEQLKRSARVSRDIPEAFDAKVLGAVSGEPDLGGPARAKTIQDLLERHRRLVEISERIEPLSDLISQNLTVTAAALNEQAGVLNKLAKIFGKGKPQLAKALNATQVWSNKHHATGKRKPKGEPKKP